MVENPLVMPEEESGVTGGSDGKICDGIICSIAQAVSRVADSKELIEAVAREFDHDDIFKSWKNYFMKMLSKI